MCAADWTMILEYLKVFLSWPPIVAACFCFFVWIFRKPLSVVIEKIRSVSFGGSGVAVQAQEAAPEEVTKPQAAAVPDLQAGMVLTVDQVNIVRQAFEAERQSARVWEYLYLNYFFAPSTQHFLNWLISLDHHVSTFDAVDAFLSAQGFPVEERKAVHDALHYHHLIEFDGPVVRVTAKGLEYARWPFRRILSLPRRTAAIPDAPAAAT